MESPLVTEIEQKAASAISTTSSSSSNMILSTSGIFLKKWQWNLILAVAIVFVIYFIFSFGKKMSFLGEITRDDLGGEQGYVEKFVEYLRQKQKQNLDKYNNQIKNDYGILE
jgi:hypothetical protein